MLARIWDLHMLRRSTGILFAYDNPLNNHCHRDDKWVRFGPHGIRFRKWRQLLEQCCDCNLDRLVDRAKDALVLFEMLGETIVIDLIQFIADNIGRDESAGRDEHADLFPESRKDVGRIEMPSVYPRICINHVRTDPD